DAPNFVRLRFQGLFEQILYTHEVEVKKYPLVICPRCGRQQERSTILRRIREGKTFLFCDEDGAKVILPAVNELVALPKKERANIEQEQALSQMRTTYEAALVSVKGVVRDRGDNAIPTCFISYAWGNRFHERWVVDLTDDLRNAGLNAVLDKFD